MKSLLLSITKYLLLPLALIYGIVVWFRNKLYDWNIFDSIEFDIPVISVGNITVGGTGKTPHIEYLIELLSPLYHVSTLSRGYRRRSRGFRIADIHSNAYDIGDEPFQYKSKYPHIDVCVAEERMTAIPQLLQLKNYIQVVLLDDAFQHRTVRPGLSILLTDYTRLYTKDYIMPFGLLRESRKAAQRADIIIITKCPDQITIEEKNNLTKAIQLSNNQHLFFSKIVYKQLYPLTPFVHSISKNTYILLVTGIAHASNLISYIKSRHISVHHLSYKDHHYYNLDDLEEIQIAFNNIKTVDKIIITTEKDASRLMLLKNKIIESKLPFYAQAIGTEILFDEKYSFDSLINEYVIKYYPKEVEVEE